MGDRPGSLTLCVIWPKIKCTYRVKSVYSEKEKKKIKKEKKEFFLKKIKKSYADGIALGVEKNKIKIWKKNSKFFFLKMKIWNFWILCRRLCRRRSRLRRGPGYADGPCGFAEGGLCRGTTPRAALGVAYADGQTWLRRGQLAVGVASHSCSGCRRANNVH